MGKARKNVAAEPYRDIDFSKAGRGPVIPAEPGKTKVSIRLDNAVIEHFRSQVERAGSGNYQTLINDALVAFVQPNRKRENAMSTTETVAYEADLNNLPPLTSEQKAELKALSEMPDSEIDHSDIAPLDDAFWKNAVQNPFYKHTKTSTTVRVDSDVLAWLKGQGGLPDQDQRHLARGHDPLAASQDLNHGGPEGLDLHFVHFEQFIEIDVNFPQF